MRHLANWLMSFWRWRTKGDLGIWRYQENTVTGRRRAIRLAPLYGPLHSDWLDGGEWELKAPKPPRGGSAVIRA